MRYLLTLLLGILLVPAAAALGTPDEVRVNAASQDVTDQTETTYDDAVNATIDIVVSPGDMADVDAECDITSGTEITSEGCDPKVKAPTAPKASVGTTFNVDLAAIWAEAQEEERDRANSIRTAGMTAGPINTLYAAAVGAATLGVLAAAAYAVTRFMKYGLVGLIPLYSHISDDELLDDGNRRRIFDLINAEPGTSTKEIADRLGLAWGTVTHHLNKLERRKFVVSKKYGKYRRYFVNGAAPRAEQKDALAILKVGATADVATAIRDRPGASQKEVSEMLGVSSSTVLWHVKRLQKADLVEKVRDGKSVRYFPGPALAREWQPVTDLVSTPA